MNTFVTRPYIFKQAFLLIDWLIDDLYLRVISHLVQKD